MSYLEYEDVVLLRIVALLDTVHLHLLDLPVRLQAEDRKFMLIISLFQTTTRIIWPASISKENHVASLIL